MLKIEIDYRETGLLDYFKDHPKSEIKKIVESKNLKIGDINIYFKDELILLIERKTMCDLASSIRDGRHREQKHRIIQSGLGKENIIFLIEGEITDMSYGKINRDILQGSIINTMFRDGFKVYRTSDINESCYFIERVLLKILKEKEKNITNLLDTENNNLNNIKKDYTETVKLKKKENLTPLVFNKLIFLQIPGVSMMFVDSIFKKYKSVIDLLEEYQKIENKKDRENLLSNLELKTQSGKNRKLGKVISKRIYDYLFVNDS